MILKTSTPLDSAMRQGYEGRAVELVKGYAHRSTLLKMRAAINDRIKLLSGPLYKGEAEQMLLFPLCEAVRQASSEPGAAAVARNAYQLAAAYALIFDISKISQSKDIANQITLSSLATQPIVRTFLAKANIELSGNDDYKDQLKKIWQAISVMASDNVVYKPTNDPARVTPLSILYEATTAQFTEADLKSNTADVWNRLLGNLRHGKGTPLDREGRKALMATISELLLRIDRLIEQAQADDLLVSAAVSSELGAPIPATTSFIDAYTAMYWLSIYLDVVDQYDVIFPATDLMVQSQAWVLVIKTQTAKLKKLFVDIAQVASAYDIFTAIKFWKEVRNFYQPVINTSLSVVGDMDALWGDCTTRAEKMLSAYAANQVSTMFDSFKSYMQADYLLPEEDFKMASDILSAYTEPEPNSDQYYLAKSGAALLSQLESVGEKPISILDRDLLIPGLASSASNVEAAIAYIKRAREVLQLTEETDDIYHALLPDGLQWTNPYALEGSIGDMKPAGFTFSDPMQLAYEKYIVTPENKGGVSTVASLDWTFTGLLMKPFYRIPQMQSFAQRRTTESRMLWPGMGELPVGDIITAEYVAQPLPACYTASRNANFVNNDFSAYLTLMSGRSGVTASSRDMFRKIAAILESYEDTYARGILDALAATMFVYRLSESNEWNIMMPSTPTIYGAPLAAMIDANSVKLSNATDDAILKRSVRVRLETGVVYQFVLHDKMPKPGPMVYVSYPYAKGVYLHVPLLRSVFKANESDIAAALRISFTDRNNKVDAQGYELDDVIQKIRDYKGKKLGGLTFISTLGWAPYLVNLPHMLCSYQDEEDVLLGEEYKKYAMLSVRVRYDSVERSIYVGGFVDNPVELLSMDDYQDAATSADPSPLPPTSVKLADDTQPDAKEPARADAEQKPDPKTIGPSPKNAAGETQEDKALEQVAAVTTAPVLAGQAIVVPQPGGDEADRIGVTNKTADQLAGSPVKAEAPEKKSSEEDAHDDEQYWKKISASGEIEDVVKAKACPNGYVPASEEEYRKFVVDKSSKENAKEE